MASSVLRVRSKKTKFAKNKKKSWKNIDITDVEDVLEDERLQERTGGLVAEKTDEQLFLVDKIKRVPAQEGTKVQQKTRRRGSKQLKCYSNLEPHPNIKPVNIAHNVKKECKDVKTLVKNYKRGKQVLKQKQKRRAEERQEEIDGKRIYDLWQDDEPALEDPHYMNVTKKRRVNVPKHYHNKVSSLPSVQVPHPGASYNPSYEDHQELLELAHIAEEKKADKEKRLYNSLEAKFKTVTRESLQETLMSEMTAGLRDDEDVAEESFTEEELIKISLNPPVRREDKKTKTQRNKEKKVKQMEKLKKEQKVTNTKDNEIYRLRSIKAEIKQQEVEGMKKAALRKQKEEGQIGKTRKLGKFKFEEPDVELKLSDELEGSLRLLKTEGNLMVDRFKSLQRRNILETRERAKAKKKFKSKKFEKKGNKEFGKRQTDKHGAAPAI